jgi:Tol biopolymer transport system component
VRLLAALVVLFVAACGGNDAEPERGATLVVNVNVRGEQSFETFAIAEGHLTPGRLDADQVYSRAGSEPDRQSIVWEEIYLRERDGSVRRLTSDRRADLAPQLLEDGRVAFVSCAYPAEDALPECRLDAIDPESGERDTLLGGLGIAFHGELSPDESRFLFTRLDPRTGGPDGLYVRELQGGAERRLVEGAGGRWSPDGRRIAFVSDRDENGRCLFHDCVGHAGEIYVADADGGNQRRLTENPETDGGPVWTGDGEWLIVGRIGDEEADWDLYAIRADGACERQLTDTDRWETPTEWRGSGHGGLSC